MWKHVVIYKTGSTVKRPQRRTEPQPHETRAKLHEVWRCGFWDMLAAYIGLHRHGHRSISHPFWGRSKNSKACLHAAVNATQVFSIVHAPSCSDGVAICFVFPVLRMTSCLHALIIKNRRRENGARTQSYSPGDVTDLRPRRIYLKWLIARVQHRPGQSLIRTIA